MRRSKFIQLLLRFSPAELSRFREMAWSPFFNKNRKLRKLIAFCLEQAPDFPEGALDKREAFHWIYGEGTAYNELQINNLLSDALQLACQLLAFQEWEAEPARVRQDQARTLLDRKADKQLPHSTRRLQQLTERIPTRSHHYFLREMQQELLLDQYGLYRAPRRETAHLQRANDALDRFYFALKLRIACDMASRNRAINAQYECHFIEEVLQLFEYGPAHLQEQPSLQTYYQALMMLSSEEEQHYRALRALLARHAPLFSSDEQQDLYDYAQNYCVKRINSGDAGYYQDILELYKLMLEQGILLRGGYLTQWSYINIVTAGIRLQEYDWTDGFIHSYREQLAPDTRDNVFTYSLAALQYGRSAFREALQTLQGVEFSDAFYHMAAKMIQLKSYYELEETEALLSLLEASRKYIKRNRQLSAYQKQSNGAFLKITGKLHKLRMHAPQLRRRERQQQAAALVQALEALPSVTNKSWLREKIAEMER